MAVCGILISVTSLVVEHGSRYKGSAVVAQGLSCYADCGIFLNEESNSCSLNHWTTREVPGEVLKPYLGPSA